MKTINRPQKVILNNQSIFTKYIYPDTNLENLSENLTINDIDLLQFEQIKKIVQAYKKAKLVDGNFQDENGNVPEIKFPLNTVLDISDNIVGVHFKAKDINDVPQGYSLSLLTIPQYEQYLEYRKHMKPVYFKNGQVVLE